MPADCRRPRNWGPLERRSCGLHLSVGWQSGTGRLLPILRGSACLGSPRRWTGMLSISCARAFASSLVCSGSEGPEGQDGPASDMADLVVWTEQDVEGGRFVFSWCLLKKKTEPRSYSRSVPGEGPGCGMESNWGTTQVTMYFKLGEEKIKCRQ